MSSVTLSKPSSSTTAKSKVPSNPAPSEFGTELSDFTVKSPVSDNNNSATEEIEGQHNNNTLTQQQPVTQFRNPDSALFTSSVIDLPNPSIQVNMISNNNTAQLQQIAYNNEQNLYPKLMQEQPKIEQKPALMSKPPEVIVNKPQPVIQQQQQLQQPQAITHPPHTQQQMSTINCPYCTILLHYPVGCSMIKCSMCENISQIQVVPRLQLNCLGCGTLLYYLPHYKIIACPTCTLQMEVPQPRIQQPHFRSPIVVSHSSGYPGLVSYVQQPQLPVVIPPTAQPVPVPHNPNNPFIRPNPNPIPSQQQQQKPQEPGTYATLPNNAAAVNPAAINSTPSLMRPPSSSQQLQSSSSKSGDYSHFSSDQFHPAPIQSAYPNPNISNNNNPTHNNHSEPSIEHLSASMQNVSLLNNNPKPVSTGRTFGRNSSNNNNNPSSSIDYLYDDPHQSNVAYTALKD